MVLTKESVFVVTSNLISAKGPINILQTQARLDSRPKGRKERSQAWTCCGCGRRGRNRVVSKGMADSCCSPISVCSATSPRLPCSQEGPCEQLRLMEWILSQHGLSIQYGNHYPFLSQFAGSLSQDDLAIQRWRTHKRSNLSPSVTTWRIAALDSASHPSEYCDVGRKYTCPGVSL